MLLPVVAGLNFYGKINDDRDGGPHKTNGNKNKFWFFSFW